MPITTGHPVSSGGRPIAAARTGHDRTHGCSPRQCEDRGRAIATRPISRAVGVTEHAQERKHASERPRHTEQRTPQPRRNTQWRIHQDTAGSYRGAMAPAQTLETVGRRPPHHQSSVRRADDDAPRTGERCGSVETHARHEAGESLSPPRSWSDSPSVCDRGSNGCRGDEWCTPLTFSTYGFPLPDPPVPDPPVRVQP